MRIYLDSNVFQILKKAENKSLYDLILADTSRNYYCFSEAHIQDLVQDKTDMKFDDMDFMKTVVGYNCWLYAEKRLRVANRTPREYFDNYDWNSAVDLANDDDLPSRLIRESFRAIPLNWHELADFSQLPEDFPDDLKDLLVKPATMLDFMDAMHDFTENLTADQLRFKRFLQYLHRSMVVPNLYEAIGIKGFDGKIIWDWDIFRSSFKDMVYQRAHQKELYHLFSDIHYALDIYGIVKGKPKKQKFISLINDGKHSYYASHAHILVTTDVDMIAKAKMVYHIWEVDTMVLTPDEFQTYLIEKNAGDNSVAKLFSLFDQAGQLPTVYEDFTLDEARITKQLPIWYLGEFNTLSCYAKRGGMYYSFEQYFGNVLLYPLFVELERVVSQFVEHFGIDDNGKGMFEKNEIENGRWEGRTWKKDAMMVILQADKRLQVYFLKYTPVIKPGDDQTTPPSNSEEEK